MSRDAAVRRAAEQSDDPAPETGAGGLWRRVRLGRLTRSDDAEEAGGPAQVLVAALERRLREGAPVGPQGERLELRPVFGRRAQVRLTLALGFFDDVSERPLWRERAEPAMDRPAGAETQWRLSAPGFAERLRAALTEDPWRGLSAAGGVGVWAAQGAETRRETACPSCKGNVGAGDCPRCKGVGAIGAICTPALCFGAGVAVKPVFPEQTNRAPELEFAPALAALNRGLLGLIERRAFTPRLLALEGEGGAYRAVFETEIPLARVRVFVGRGVEKQAADVWALGEPLGFLDPPALLDKLHELALDRLLIRSGADLSPLADHLAGSALGRGALQAAAAFEPRFDPKDMAFRDRVRDAAPPSSNGADAAAVSAANAAELTSDALMTGALADRLFAFAQRTYRALGLRLRRRLWAGFVLAAPALAVLLCAAGYVGAVDALVVGRGAVTPEAPRRLMEGATLALWALPFAALWFVCLYASLAHYRRTTRRILGRALGGGWPEGLWEAMRLGRQPLWALAIGGALYGAAFLGAAPRGSDRLEVAAEAQLLTRFRAPFLADLFDGAAEARRGVSGLLGVEIAEGGPPLDPRRAPRESILAARARAAAFAASPGRWRVIDDVASAKTFGPSGEAGVGVACLGAGAVAVLVTETPPPALAEVRLTVNRVALPSAVVEARGGAVSWAPSAGALAALRRGVALRIEVRDFAAAEAAPAPMIYDISLSGSAAALREALAPCGGG